MANLAFPLLLLGIVAPLLAAAAIWFGRKLQRPHALAQAAAAVSALCGLEALREAIAAEFAPLADPLAQTLFLDALSATPFALFATVALGVLLILPRRDATPRVLACILLVIGSTLAAYAAANPLLFLAAWVVSTAPVFLSKPDRNADGSHAQSALLPSTMLTASSIALAISLGLMAWDVTQSGGAAFTLPLQGSAPGGMWAFAFLMLAVVLRKGMFPFHSWVVTAFKRGPLLTTALLVNTHLGAYAVARIAIPAFPEVAGSALSIIGDLALLTAIYAAVVALAETDPRRLIGLLVISQASFILAGLDTATTEGAAGGLLYWMLVTVATTSLAAVYRLVEVRVGRPISGDEFLGLANHFPRLAVFFIVSGLALVGLPGTLGFCADELLLHGAMESHPQLGIALPLATALNAFHLYRLFSRLFLGSRGVSLPGVPDARPAERWVLTCGLLFLIGGGLFPGSFLELRLQAADTIAHTATAANHVLSGLLP